MSNRRLPQPEKEREGEKEGLIKTNRKPVTHVSGETRTRTRVKKVTNAATTKVDWLVAMERQSRAVVKREMWQRESQVRGNEPHDKCSNRHKHNDQIACATLKDDGL